MLQGSDVFSVLQCVDLNTGLVMIASTRMLQCVAVCCSVLQCVAVCCSVLQCVAVCPNGTSYIPMPQTLYVCKSHYSFQKKQYSNVAPEM